MGGEGGGEVPPPQKGIIFGWSKFFSLAEQGSFAADNSHAQEKQKLLTELVLTWCPRRCRQRWTWWRWSAEAETRWWDRQSVRPASASAGRDLVVTITQHLTSLAVSLFIHSLKAYSPVNHTGSPQGFSLSQITHKSNLTEVEYHAKHARFTNIKHTNIIRKLVPSELLSQKMANKVRRCWYHWPFWFGISIPNKI